MAIKWSISPDELCDGVEQDISKQYRKTAIKIYNQVIQLSPVDTGRYRGNHILSVDKPDYSVNDNGAISGVGAINSITDGKFPPIYIQNNLPYASVIEYGGYPKQVKLGTWKKGKGFYEIRSVGGYSVQAPQGVYQLAVESVKFN